MSRRSGQREELRRKITRGIVLDTGTREQIAVQYADAVMRVLDDMRGDNGMLYVAARSRQYDVLQIQAAIDRGDSQRKIQRDFRISRKRLLELFPDGLLPQVEQAG